MQIMKKNVIVRAALMAALTLGLTLSCAKEESKIDEEVINPKEEVNPAGPSVIKAGIPDEITKVSLTDKGVGSGMGLAWQDNDEIRVIATEGGSGNELFTLTSYEGKNAEFSGTSVTGTKFTVFYPGTYADVDAINARIYTAQTQIGNGSTAHLEWNAIETELTDYGTVTFSSKQNGALRFRLQLPSAFTKVYKVALKAPTAIFSTTNGGSATTDELVLTLKADANTDGITLGGDKILTAYMMVSWNDNTIPANTDLTIEVWGDQEMPWTKVKNVGSSAYTIAGGKVTNVQLNNSSWDEPLFWAGDGTSSSPYIIKTAYHLGNVKVVMDANPTAGLYFKLANDIDLEGAVWEQVNQVDPHTPYTIYFDGNNNTISNFSIAKNAATGLSSFFGEISGEVKNLNFSDGSIVSGGKNCSAGILAGIAQSLIVTNVDANNVDITMDGTAGATVGVGGLIGYAVNSTISNCDLTYCDIDLNGTSTQNVGGLVGRLRGNASSVTNCSVSSATISAKYCAGGLIGKIACTSGPVNVKGNTVTEMNVSYVGDDSGTLSGAGGLVGAIQAEPENTEDPAIVVNIGAADAANTVTSLTISQTPGYAGGLVGYLRAGDMTFVNNSVAGTITSAGEYVGGFIGRSRSNGAYDNCSFNGSVTGAYFVGGLFGGDEDYREYTMNNCHSEGSVEATSHFDFYDDASFVGGLIGLARSEKADGIVLTNCWSSADVTGNLGYVGGLIGDSVGVTLGEKVGDTITASKACEYKNGTITGHGDSGNTKASSVGGLVAMTRGSYITKIYGGKLTSASVNGANYVGGIIGYNNKSDIVVEGCSVSSGTINSSRYYVAGIVGYSNTGTFSTSYCTVDADITGVTAVGGILSYKWDGAFTVSHCSVSGSVTATGTASFDGFTMSMAGGIAAYTCSASSSISYCDVTANITAVSTAGGIVGRNKGGTFDHCTYSTGTISAGERVGGISGSNTGAAGTFTNCSVSGTLECTGDFTGGILGRNHNGGTTITNCFVNAEVDGPNKVGGIIGEAGGDVTITSCGVKGAVKGTATNNDVHYIGGIAGNMNGSIQKSYCKADVTYKTNRAKAVGGLAGYTNGATTIDECYYDGNIYAYSQGGGLVAVVMHNTTIRNCYSAGTITNLYGYFGGMTGYVNAAVTVTASNCYSTMQVQSTDSGNALGGFFGGSGRTDNTWAVSGLLAWNSSISFNTSNTTDGVIAGQIHSGASSASTSFSNCWYRNDLSYTIGTSRVPGDDADVTAGGKIRYDGKRAASGVSCSTKASEIGWDGTTIWDLTSGDYPILKRVVAAE